MVFEPGDGADRRAHRGAGDGRRPPRARLSACRASACSRPATSSSSRGRSRRARSATPIGRCCSRSSPVPAPTRSISARRTTTRLFMTATLDDAVDRCDAVITSGGVSVGDFDYVSDALERIAADDPRGDSRVDWYQVAIKPAKPLVLRDGAGHPGVRAPRQPGVVVRELRAVRPTGAAPDDGPPPDVPAARSVPPPPTRCPGRSTGSSISTGSSSTWSTVATSRPRVRSQESNALAATAAANGARAAYPTATASPPATTSPSCCSTDTPPSLASAHSVPTGETGGARSRLTRPRRSRPLTPSQPARRAEPALA